MTTTQPAALPEHTIGKHDHPEPHTMCWSDLELGAIKRYAESYALAALQPQPAAEVSDAEWWHGVLGSAGPDLLNLAKQWSDNEVHVYQFVNEAEKIVKAAAQRAILALRPQAVPMTWPKARDVGRFGDMHPMEHLRVGLDSDNDVYVSVWSEKGGASVEFCNPGGGGGGSSRRTREALIALMVAMEADNAERPDKDWWARRNGITAQGAQGGEG